MSLIASAAAAAASPTAGLFAHGHKKGAHAPGKDATAAGGASGPATTQSLLSSLFESIEQVIGISLTAPARPVAAAAAAAAGAVGGASAAAASAPATAAPGVSTSAAVASNAASGSAQDGQGFLHSLVQALKAERPGASAGNPPPGGAAVGTEGGAGAARYDASLASSLQALMHQVETGSPATANLSASFDRFVQGTGGAAAGTGSVAAAAAPQPSLQNFLGNLLRNMQSNGVHSMGSMGGSVDAKV